MDQWLYDSAKVGGIIGGLYAIGRGFRWAVEFMTGRLDKRASALEDRERLLERRFDARLRHLEKELEQYREATMVLVNALAERDPANPALKEVAQILRRAVPREPELPEDIADYIDRIDTADRNRGR